MWHCTSSICGSIIYICYRRLGVTFFTLLMVLQLYRMCQCLLHIGIRMRLLAQEPRITKGLLLLCRCPCGTILQTLVRWCGTDGFLEQGQCFFIFFSCLLPFLSFTVFSSFFLWVGIVGMVSSDWWGVKRCLPALHCLHFLIMILIIIIIIMLF